MAIDLNAFREALARFSTGVTVVTTAEGERRYGLTANSFAGVSMEPPLVLVCVARRLPAHDAIRRSGSFAVNILEARQLDVGMVFAGLKGDVLDRFEGLVTKTGGTGAPFIEGSLASFDCRLWNQYDGGDHSIFVGLVENIALSDGEVPLVYHNRLWRNAEN